MESDVSRLDVIFVDIQKVLYRRLMRILGNSAIAEEVTQEAYLRTRKSFDVAKPQNIEALLWTTARNLALDHMRKERVRSQRTAGGDCAAEIESVPDDRISIEESLIQKDQIRILQAALEKLPVRAREGWFLSRVEGKSYPEIAVQLGVSPNTVFNDIKMVMAMLYDLRKKLGE